MTAQGTKDSARGALVEAAIKLLAEEGPNAVQARRLAREIGASTMAVYHYFGGMGQLLRAVCDDGFRRLEAHLATVPATSDPVADITRLALAYRESARTNPHLYDLMFGLSAPGGYRPEDDDQPPSEAGTPAESAYAHLVEVVRRAEAEGRIHGAAEPVAAQFWSVLHGFVTLELAGHLDQFDDPLTQVLVPLGGNLLIGLGDQPDRTAESTAAR